MIRNKLSFESEKLLVDYISFNITSLIDYEKINQIVIYLSQSFYFNSSIATDSIGKEQSLIHDSRLKINQV